MDDLRSRVLPYIKPDVSGEPGEAIEVSHDDSPVIRDLGNGLLVLYAVDEGSHFSMVQHRDLAAAGLDGEEMHRAAMDNFFEFVAGRTRVQPYGSIHALLLDGNFEASLLLVDPLWDESLAPYAPNGFVAAVPARDVLAFADAASPQGIEELRALIARLGPDCDHPISSELYRREHGTWARGAP